MQTLRSVPLQASLGESPIWCARTQTLWMVDIRGKCVLQLDPATSQFTRFNMPDLTGMVAFTDTGLLVGVGRSIYEFNPQTGKLSEALVEFDTAFPENRINDSKVAPDGTLWCGTMCRTENAASGSLYNYHYTKGVRSIRTDLTIPNALCFSPDAQSVFFADTTNGSVLKATLDTDTPDFVPFAAKDIAPGYPDGSCMDAQGYIWNARYGGSCVVRINPLGKIDQIIQLPVSQPTCCALGGADMTTLFITTAAQNLNEAALSKEPLAGDVFMVSVEVPGLPEPVFKK